LFLSLLLIGRILLQTRFPNALAMPIDRLKREINALPFLVKIVLKEGNFILKLTAITLLHSQYCQPE
jgi:hypothetical protein